MVYSYCKENDQCTQSEVVATILNHFVSYLGSGCNGAKTEPEVANKIILALKGIGNMGMLPSRNTSISQCMTDPAVPLEVRLGALDAFRRVPCRQLPLKAILSVYTNTKEDTEVRIKAYLNAMKCANRGIIDTVKDTLYNDEVNQGSYKQR